MSQFGIAGQLLLSACPVTSHSHLKSQLHSPVLSAAPHHQSTQYIYLPAPLTLISRLFFVIHARLSSTLLQTDFQLPTLPLNSPALCPWLWEFPLLLWMLFCLWLLSINSHQLCCRVSFSFHLFVIIGGSDTCCVASLAIVWTPRAFSPVGFHLQKLIVCLSLPGIVNLYSGLHVCLDQVLCSPSKYPIWFSWLYQQIHQILLLSDISVIMLTLQMSRLDITPELLLLHSVDS